MNKPTPQSPPKRGLIKFPSWEGIEGWVKMNAEQGISNYKVNQHGHILI